MAATQVKKQFDSYFSLLSEKQQLMLLEMVKSLLNIDKEEQRISLEQYNIEIEASVKQIKAGKTVSHADVVKRSKAWFKRK
jgi:hypothetical protein